MIGGFEEAAGVEPVDPLEGGVFHGFGSFAKPLPDCLFHLDRGSQYASEMHPDMLDEHGFVGSMSRHGASYNNPQAESLVKPLKMEDAYLIGYEMFEDEADEVPRFV